MFKQADEHDSQEAEEINEEASKGKHDDLKVNHKKSAPLKMQQGTAQAAKRTKVEIQEADDPAETQDSDQGKKENRSIKWEGVGHSLYEKAVPNN